MPNLLHLLYYRLGMGDKPPFLGVDKLMFTKLNPGTGDKPLFLKLDMAIIVRSIVLAFRLRSRHPVRPEGRTAYNDNDAQGKHFLFIDVLRNRPARVGSSL